MQIELGGQQHRVSCLLVPLLLQLLASPTTQVRQQSLSCLNMMADVMPQGLMDNVQA